MAIVKTIIKVPSLDAQYSVPADLSAAQVASMYAQNLPGIGAMTATETVVTLPEGDVREITFSPRSGNKG